MADLPAEGSVVDGRTVVYLEIIPSNAQSGAENEGGGAAKAKAPVDADGEGDAADKGGEFEPEESDDHDQDGKDKKKRDVKKRAKPTIKEMLPTSKLAAAANQAASMIAAAESGAPFCEDCAEAHRLLEEASRLA